MTSHSASSKQQAKETASNSFEGAAGSKSVALMPPTYGIDTLDRGLIAPILQPKLSINTPGDVYEQEADQVANRVMGMPNPILQRSATTNISSTEASSSVDDTLQSSGQPLDTSTRNFMEQRFGQDFSHVRVHTNSQAAQSAKDINAKAYTISHHVVFGRDQYAPNTPEGKRLLAHELAHVVQQRQQITSMPLNISHRNDSTEVEANQAAIATIAGGTPSVGSSIKTPLIQREEEDAWGVASKYWGEKKRAVYKTMISGIRHAQSSQIIRMQTMTRDMSSTQQEIANGLIEGFQLISDFFISLLFAVVGLVVGFVAGIAAALWGIIKLIMGILSWIALAILSFFSETRKEELNDKANAFLNGLKNFMPNLQKVYEHWMDRYQKSNTDEQTLMIGELTGEIEALLVTLETGSQIASKAPQLTVSLAPVRAFVPTIGPSLSGGAATISMNVAGPGAAATMTMMTSTNVEQKAQDIKQSEQSGVNEKTKSASEETLGKKTPIPSKVKGPEVFDELSKELKLTVEENASGAGSAVEDAVSAGFTDKTGKPQAVDLALQSHSDASAVRGAHGMSGTEYQSAHIGPTSALREVAGYSRGRAETVLLPREIHAAFDAHWKQWAQNLRRAGTVDVSTSQLYEEMLAAIDQIPNVSQRMKDTMAWRMELELFRDLGLSPSDRITLPYSNIKPL